MRIAATKHPARLLLNAALIGLVLAPTVVSAQPTNYPNKAIRFIVGFPPGNAMDIRARQYADKLSTALGQSIIVENKPGASGAIAAEFVAKAPPDGYTLFTSTGSEIALNPAMGTKLAYDPAKDFIPVAFMSAAAPLVIASPSLGVNSIAELVALAKSKPGAVSWGSVNIFQHIAVASFAKAAGITVNVIPYKGGVQAMSDAMSGQVNLTINYPAEVGQHVKAGRLRALATFGERRVPLLPDAPTLAEAGYRGLEMLAWSGLFAPTGTPPEIVRRLNSEMVKAGQIPDLRDTVVNSGGEILPLSVEQYNEWVRAEMTKWRRLVQESGVKFE